MQFKTAKLNKTHIICTECDHYVQMRGYAGWLTLIKDAGIVDAMIARGSNLVARKPPDQVPEADTAPAA